MSTKHKDKESKQNRSPNVTHLVTDLLDWTFVNSLRNGLFVGKQSQQSDTHRIMEPIRTFDPLLRNPYNKLLSTYFESTIADDTTPVDLGNLNSLDVQKSDLYRNYLSEYIRRSNTTVVCS